MGPRTPEKKERNDLIERLRAQGTPFRQIATQCGISHQRVQEILRERSAKRARGRYRTA